jgi:basic membrane protein A and related proteins
MSSCSKSISIHNPKKEFDRRKIMKRLISMVMAIAMISIILAGCSGAKPAAGGTATKATLKVAELIGSTGSIDDRSFCQGAWEGIKKFAEGKSVETIYYKAVDESTGAFIDSVTLAVKSGAQVLVCPGYTWEPAVFKAQDMYPDTKFVLIDGTPRNEDYSQYKINSNVYSIFFSEQEAGFLAGYAIVKEGYHNLGFLGGMAVPAVLRYGYGYVVGADAAAKELGLAKDAVTLKYHYAGNFDPSPENQTYAASWFSSGTEAIFACAGEVGNVVMAAGKQVGPDKVVIGVDVDQAKEAPNVITSAMKNLANATSDALEKYLSNTFPGGKSVTLTVNEDGVGLPTAADSWRLKKFTVDDYNKIIGRLKADENGLSSKLPKDTDYKAASDIPVELIKVVVD